MPIDERAWGETLAQFQAESGELVTRLTRGLVALERTQPAARPGAIEGLGRSLHTLKGSAGMIGIPEVQGLIHELETAVRRAAGAGPGELEALVSAALAALDTAQGWIARACRQEPIGEGELAAALQALSRLRPAEGVAPGAVGGGAPAAPRPEEPPGGDGGFLRVGTRQVDRLLAQAEEVLGTGSRLRRRTEALGLARDQLNGAVRELSRAKRAAGRGSKEKRALAAELIAGPLRELTLVRRSLAEAAWELTGESERIDGLSAALLAGLREARMLPVAWLFDGFERPVRELALEHGKKVQLTLRGGEVRLDKRVLDGLKEPLVHLLRNAVAHGLETPGERVAAGKPEVGTVVIGAEPRGNRVLVTVQDDGRGIDGEKVKSVAVRRGLLDEAGAGLLSEEALHEVLFRPGFSTCEAASQVAGRGMGLSAVREASARLKGEAWLDRVPGGGTRFTLSVPLTVASTRGLLVSAARELYALPVGSVERVVRVVAREVKAVQGLPAFEVGGEAVRLLALTEVVGRAAPAPAAASFPAVVVASGRRRLLLQVDELLGELELITRDLPGPLSGSSLLAGATVLDDGRVVPVLDAEGVFREAASLGPARPSGERARAGRVLVVDDSATTRMLMASELEAAGFQVVTAPDGRRALEVLASEGADALVSDVDMPNLDGFELTRAVRASPALSGLPVVLVTSKDAPADRARGAEAGADAYLVKKDFARRDLLEALGRLMRRRGLS
ncbi:MAG: hybrid sensor histidine kinase/response regulator [Myxococcaceae bacterium]